MRVFFSLKVSCRSTISVRQSLKVTSHKSPVDKKMPKGSVRPFFIQQRATLHLHEAAFCESQVPPALFRTESYYAPEIIIVSAARDGVLNSSECFSLKSYSARSYYTFKDSKSLQCTASFLFGCSENHHSQDLY